MPWLQLSNVWLLTIGSQVEAKGRTKDLNGSQEAKRLLLETNIYTKTSRISFKSCIKTKI